jgi:hypothetical protein
MKTIQKIFLNRTIWHARVIKIYRGALEFTICQESHLFNMTTLIRIRIVLN